MPDIRVLHIVQTPLDFVGGPATYVLELSKHLAKSGVKVGIISPKPSVISKEIKALCDNYGVTTYYVDLKVFKSLLRMPWMFSIRAHKLISQVVNNYDVVNIHVECTLFQYLLNIIKVPTILTVHTLFPHEDIEVLKFKLNIYKTLHLLSISPQHFLSMKYIAKKADFIISLSRYVSNILTSAFRIPKMKIKVIYNAVDTDLFKHYDYIKSYEVVNSFLQRTINKSLPRNKKIILYIGRLDPRKGIDVLIESVSRIRSKDWMLLIVGEGDRGYTASLRAMSIKLGVSDETFFIGKVPLSILPYLYSIAYVYVLPSFHEGLPATLLEAFSSGTPVIATKVWGIPEVVINGFNGYLVERGSVDDITKAIVLLLKDESQRNLMANNAIKIANNFSWNYAAGEYFKLYKQLVSSPIRGNK